MELERIVAGLVEKVERRYYGKYRGFVVDNADPEQLGRLRLQVPSVLGYEVVTGWAFPCTPYGGMADQGFLFIPEIGAGVWVEFEEGDLEFPIWVGTFWSKPGGESELPKANGEIQDPPTQKIIKTKKGHTIQLEDKDDEEKIVISHEAGASVQMDKDGSVVIVNKTGSFVYLNAEDGELTLGEEHGNLITLTGDGVLIANKESKITVEMKEGKLTILAGEAVDVMASKFNIHCSTISLGGQQAVQSVILGEVFQGLYSAHTHATAVGPSGPPVPPWTPPLALSQKVKVMP